MARRQRRLTVTPSAALTPGMLKSFSFLFPARRRCSMVRKSVRPTDAAWYTCVHIRRGDIRVTAAVTYWTAQ